MNDVLIGHTGFVGSTLARSMAFPIRLNSKTIGQIDGLSLDTVVCAGVSAVKWLANKEPAADWAAIDGLIGHLATTTAKHFVLISTIDVYHQPVGVTEADVPPVHELHPYGLHRLRLEHFVARQFANHSIIRLPALFGEGLRKNIIFDLLNGNQTDRISPGGLLQWYPMRRFASDLTRIIAAAPRLINIAVEPVLTETIRRRFFPHVMIGSPGLPAPQYDMHTSLAGVLGRHGNYHLTAKDMMTELEAFVVAERHSA